MRNTKYWPLTSYLQHCGKDELALTFEEIEHILGFELPSSAKEYRANWANTTTVRFPLSWLDAGYMTHDVDMVRGIVNFSKGSSVFIGESRHDLRERKRIEKTFEGEDGHVILLNKPFLGGWLDDEGNIGHEIIDFLFTDNNEYFVYNNPWGACPDNIWVEGTTKLVRNSKEKYIGKYMVLTSETRNKDFDILYVIELKEKLHRYHIKKEESLDVRCPKEMVGLIKELNAVYNGRYLYDIFEYESLCLTFRGNKIYKAVQPITITGLNYNFQRNKGYIYNDQYPNDYSIVLSTIENAIADGKLVDFTPRNVNREQIGDLNANKTFLDLISMQDSEQVYTNILHSLLEQGDLLKHFCLRFKEDKAFDFDGVFKVFRETKVVDGRMDVCAESENQRIIIENKVYSGLNGLKPVDNKTQLSTYYDWGKIKKIDPLCFVVAPNFRLGDIKTEISNLDPLMKPVYLVKTYGDIADFIEKEYSEGNIPQDYTYYSLIPQIINAFKNFSYSTKEDLYARKFLEATN